MSKVVVVVGIVVALVLVGLAVAWMRGAFVPPMSRLPVTAGAYSIDASTQKSSATILDSATYRAGSGDIYAASIVKDAPDPSIAFGAAKEASRFSSGQVFCTGVSKTGKGGNCRTKLSTGSVVSVDASTRHTAEEIAQFTADVAAGVA